MRSLDKKSSHVDGERPDSKEPCVEQITEGLSRADEPVSEVNEPGPDSAVERSSCERKFSRRAILRAGFALPAILTTQLFSITCACCHEYRMPQKGRPGQCHETQSKIESISVLCHEYRICGPCHAQDEVSWEEIQSLYNECQSMLPKTKKPTE